jgi:hypothetical protein
MGSYSPTKSIMPETQISSPPLTIESNAGTSQPQDYAPLVKLTTRSVVLALILAALFGVIIPINDYQFNNTYLGAAHLPPGAVAVLLLLLAFQPILALAERIRGRWKLSRNEILTVYITCLFSVLVPGRAGENFFVTNLLGPFYFATRENKWMEFLQPYLRPWFTPALNSNGSYNAKLVEDWYLGNPKGTIPWGAWLIPLLAWTLLIGALYWMLACLAVMLRGQWAEREALSFPLLRLPLEITEDGGVAGNSGRQFFRNPTMWIGFGLAVFLEGINGLNVYFPDVPAIPLQLNTGPLLTEAPWNQMGPFSIRVIPLMVAISFLVTTEVALSFWFFYLLHKLEMIGAYQLGFAPSSLPDPVWTRGFAKSFISYQNIGAYFAFAALIFWTGREHYRYIFHRALGRESKTEAEKLEALSYPAAFWGFIGTSLFLMLWTVAAGVRLEIALVMWFSYLVIALVLTRVVVEGGLLYVNHGWSPLGPLAHLIGSGPGAVLGPSSIVPGSIIQGALMVDMKAFLLPSFLHAFKLAHDRRIPLRPLLALIFAAITISYGLGVYTNIRLGYSSGGLELQAWFARSGAQDPALNANVLLRGADDNHLLNWLWFSVGAILLWGIVIARSLFSWFPLHPVGFIMWSPYVMYVMWFSIFLGWLCKVLIMRFGGTETYKRIIPAFIGLALGDVAMMILWVIIDAWQGQTNHSLMGG